MYETGCMAAMWALDRSVSGLNDNIIRDSMIGTISPVSSAELKKVVEDYTGQGMLDGRYVPSFVSDVLNTEDIDTTGEWVVETYKFVLHGTEIDLCVACSKEDTEEGLHTSLLKTMIYGLDCIERAVSLVDPEMKEDMSKYVSVMCLMLDEPRALPENDGEAIGVEDINAGVTQFVGEERHVLIYRKQHAHKVLLHEVIHAMDLDSGLYVKDGEDVPDAEADVMTQLNYGSSTDMLNWHETYTELLACYWHLFMYVPGNCRMSGLDVRTSRNVLWGKENARYLEACATIVDHHAKALDLNYADYAEEDDSTVMKFIASLEMEEDTHVFSYFIAKAAMWARLDKISLIPSEDVEVESFRNALREAVLDPAFWRRVVRSGASEELTMTALEGKTT